MEILLEHPRATVFHADCLELLASLEDSSVDLFQGDPPFGIGYQNNFTKSRHEVLTGDSEAFDYGPLAKEAYRILRPDTAFLAFTGWSTFGEHSSQVVSAGFRLREPLIIQKRPSGKTALRTEFQSNADWIIYATKGTPKFRPTQLVRNKRAGTVPNPGRNPVPEWKTRFPSCWFGPEYPRSTANPSTQKKFPHPTPKDPLHAEWLTRILTDPGGVVVDPTCGSGGIAAGAMNAGRRIIAGDISREFAEMTAERLREILAIDA